ncbi:YbjN domain-containing protein [Deinococcus aerius]|uniref:YbjN domain-containing protein n=1 Tax=Deinococcus aerius TaxID=200253 RepID=A0A2I9CYB6_9DEIO|nr:YbjN domain-containing protein [Deinococcus aerius]GBF07134.1 YbjN domain-containing protein [Deinococcus aerius]
MNKASASAAALLLSVSLSGALAGGAGAPLVGGGQVQAATPEAVTAALRAAGYTVTANPIREDEDPSVTVRAGGRELDVWFSGCREGSCARVTASYGWDPEDEADLNLDFVNEWNGNYYTQAYVYEGRYYLDSTMPLRGGYTRAALNAWMTDYLTDVEDFEGELP